MRDTLGSALAFGLILAAAGLAGCRQASCVWEEAKQGVSNVVPKPCCPDAQGRIVTVPVYAGSEYLDPRVGTGGTGAFQRP